MRVLFVIALAACAPVIDGPLEQQRAVDRADADRIARLLEAIPGVAQARVELHRSVVDPFTQRASPASAAVVIVGEVPESTVRALVQAAAPDVPPPTIALAAAPAEPVRDDKPLLVAALALLALAAAFVAYRERPYARRGSSAQ